MKSHEGLLPCRECGAPCSVQTFSHPEKGINATLWMCSRHRSLGGDCPNETAYFYEAAWNTPTPSPSGARGISERARELLAAEIKADPTWQDAYRDRETGALPPDEEWSIRASGMLASLRAIESALRSQGRGEGEFAIGTPVRCQIDNMKAEWRHEWADWTGFIARIDYCSQNGVNYSVSEEWPPKHLTDGFAPNELATISEGM